ncbi:nicotinamide riboside transporter PnuC [Pseudomonas sp. zbq_18]|uniref:nicotinamide riboside transporter PnuC n=1 Tax=Pseudomonas sp. zbq_18 TaxID=3367251 RepID=UPI003709F798
MTPLEIIASALGITSVWLTVQQNKLCWPIGLVMVLLYAWFFFDAKLYSLVLLHGVFAAMQLYGWWQWNQGVDDSGQRPVSSATRLEVSVGLSAAACVGLALGLTMSSLTEAAYPWMDAQLTAFSLLAQLWMALKRWQCWLLWVVVDVLYVGFFAFQSYWLTAGLYGVFIALALLGLREWRASRVQAA